jgi:hypothetical protein
MVIHIIQHRNLGQQNLLLSVSLFYSEDGSGVFPRNAGRKIVGGKMP